MNKWFDKNCNGRITCAGINASNHDTAWYLVGPYDIDIIPGGGAYYGVYKALTDDARATLFWESLQIKLSSALVGAIATEFCRSAKRTKYNLGQELVCAAYKVAYAMGGPDIIKIIEGEDYITN